jgi:hypothetical protein
VSTCSFCDRSNVKMANEHVFPRWLSKVGASNMGGDYVMDRQGKQVRSKIIQLKTRRVCEDCNTGWMSRIEDLTIPVLTPLLHATTNRITELDRWVIARWFSKTILTAQLAMTARDQAGPLHPLDYQTLHAHAQPFQNQFTLIAGYTGTALPILFQIHSPDESTNRGVRAFFHFHRVILMAFFMKMDGDNSVISIPGHLIDAVHVIWPTQRELGPFNTGDPTLSLSWPPNELLFDEQAVNAMIETFPAAQDPDAPLS